MKLVILISILGWVLISFTVANATPVGMVSFDNFIPADPSADPPVPGLNAFGISNFTGSFALLPDFPVTDELIFTNSSLALTFGDGATNEIILGDIGLGFFDASTLLQFSTTQTFLKAVFAATVSPTQFMADETLFEALTTTLTATLLPSSEEFLTAGVALAVLDLPARAVTPVPEPSTALLLASGIIGLSGWLRRKRNNKLHG